MAPGFCFLQIPIYRSVSNTHRTLAPRIYEGGGPKGRGEYTPVLIDSPSFAPLSSPLTSAGAKMRLRRLVTAR